MRFPTSVVIALGCASAFAQAAPQLPMDRYDVHFGEQEGEYYFYIAPDSLTSHAAWHPRDTAMWAFDLYLFDNYAEATYEQYAWEDLLPDTARVRSAFQHALGKDTAFAKLYQRSFRSGSTSTVLIDTLMRIAARFYYLHRTGTTGLDLHLCTGINRVKELAHDGDGPYYAAFCYQAIRDMDDPYLYYRKAKEALPDSLYSDMPTDRVLAAEQGLYDLIAEDIGLREFLLAEYARKEPWLCFRLAR